MEKVTEAGAKRLGYELEISPVLLPPIGKIFAKALTVIMPRKVDIARMLRILFRIFI
jgi:hypothetical protein